MDITQFTGICKVIETLNARFNAQLDSCLVLKYCSSSASTSLHSDDESSLDSTQPICNLTIGTGRTIEFVSMIGGKPVCNINMEHRGVVLMKVGTQSVLKHMVRGDSKKNKELRYSLSFRALAKKTSAVAKPQTPPQSVASAPTQNVAQSAGGSVSQKRHVCLIAGDSYAHRLDVLKLGKKTVSVESVARGGAQIHHVMGHLKHFASTHIHHCR